MSTNVHASATGIEWIDSTRFEQLYPYKRRTFFAWIAEGRLTAYKPSKRKTLVKRQDIDHLLEASRTDCDINTLVDEVVNEVAGR